MSDDTDNNVMPFRVVQGNDPEIEVKSVSEYYIQDVDGNEYVRQGFLIFTAQHVAVMKDTSDGAVPALVLPLTRVRLVELIEDDDDDDEFMAD